MPINDKISLHRALLPLSFLYGIIVRVRNQLFDWGILPVEQFDVPVISIGNLAVGGTGKTPHTEYLIRLLQPYVKVGVLSRGYKRKTKGFVLAEPGRSSVSLGDEPFLIKQKFPDAVVAVDEDRRNGIHQLLALPDGERPEVILLDDAFQHRYVTPSLSVVLTDYNRLFFYDKLLPVGRLRENATNIRRADVIVVSKCDDEIKPIDSRVIMDDIKTWAYQRVFFTGIQYDNLRLIFSEPELEPKPKKNIKSTGCIIHFSDHRTVKKDELKKKEKQIDTQDEVLLVTGIAHPEVIEAKVKLLSKNVQTIHFSDHHAFSKGDIKRIDKIFQQMNPKRRMILTTEKDAVRLIEAYDLPEEWKACLYALPIKVKFCFSGQEEFDELVLKHVREFSTTRIKY